MARVGQRLTYDQLVVGQIYKIEAPTLVFPADVDERDEDPGEPEFRVRTWMGKLVTKARTGLIFSTLPRAGERPARLTIDANVSTAPIQEDSDDLRPRISMTATEVVTQKALSAVNPDVAARIRGFTGGRRRKSRRKHKKTLRRK